MTIRVGVEGGRSPVLERARQLGAPLLISANSLWDNKRRRFRGFDRYVGFDVALDSGGFVAMKHGVEHASQVGRPQWQARLR